MTLKSIQLVFSKRFLATRLCLQNNAPAMLHEPATSLFRGTNHAFRQFTNSPFNHVTITESKAELSQKDESNDGDSSKILRTECGDVTEHQDEEMEEMFVDAFEGFLHKDREWGGPTRGGRFPEPTRYGDWERKGRCTDF
mmetsp:Transcript_22640/g.33424  ORF Transcript_22640/g.33424 Transcript_22640/m.33424 type:complete len:140 (-) Transcript_22640:329-748(-)|eukprot:CAMPEP_0194224824 /NCGR_PEP_ID=MMETSP0156-20130528/38242_1 /TAXON_ID=33649 /ORGANISM="Thalassionema nitzschioides, Strain L26-B" /LENGTH=139 /DNA_ID=CAMNT_0038956537 /DNA_START=10 /DNA_END=429 /DNA_ORIENTATION=+